MLAPQTLITATLVTIAEPLEAFGSEPACQAGQFVECVVCGDCFDDESPAYTIGAFPGALLHINCV